MQAGTGTRTKQVTGRWKGINSMKDTQESRREQVENKCVSGWGRSNYLDRRGSLRASGGRLKNDI